jgi:hypothetical protein
MTGARDVLNAVAIYDGTTYCGEVVELRCGVFQAADAHGKVIGTFADARAAAHAVLMHEGRPHG